MDKTGLKHSMFHDSEIVNDREYQNEKFKREVKKQLNSIGNFFYSQSIGVKRSKTSVQLASLRKFH